LRSHDLMLEGDYFELVDRTAYQTISENFNNAFLLIDRRFLDGRNRLDDENASVKKKQLFIQDLKKQATAGIVSLINHYKKQYVKKIINP